MSDLHINGEGFYLKMDLLESDFRFQSFKLSIKAQINHPTGHFNYEADNIWFQREVWEYFVSRLKVIDNIGADSSIELEDMSGLIVIAIKTSKQNEFKLFFKFEEPYPNTNAKLSYEQDLDRDELYRIREGFLNFAPY
ncbi:MAG: hypothetical protein ACXVB0_20490 [Mucilaginibacter sp.]